MTKPSMSMFATRADYNAALDADKTAVLRHYAAEEAKAAADEQQAKDAARWQWLNRCASDTQWQTVRMFDDCSEADAYIDAQIANEQ